MTRAVFFDWYNTLAGYNPPIEDIQVEACLSAGLKVEPAAVWKALPQADQYFYEENARLPVDKRPPDEKAKIYFKYEKVILDGAGVQANDATVFKVLLKMRELSSSSRVILFNDSLPVMKQLRDQGLILGVVSNLPEDKLPQFDELGLRPFLDFVMTPREAGADKPDPLIFKEALKRSGIPANEALHIGDQYLSDIVGARAASIRAILLDRRNLFSEIRDCPRITSLTQIFQYL